MAPWLAQDPPLSEEADSLRQIASNCATRASRSTVACMVVDGDTTSTLHNAGQARFDGDDMNAGVKNVDSVVD